MLNGILITKKRPILKLRKKKPSNKFVLLDSFYTTSKEDWSNVLIANIDNINIISEEIKKNLPVLLYGKGNEFDLSIEDSNGNDVTLDLKLVEEIRHAYKKSVFFGHKKIKIAFLK